jgi:hypothetical protein
MILCWQLAQGKALRLAKFLCNRCSCCAFRSCLAVLAPKVLDAAGMNAAPVVLLRFSLPDHDQLWYQFSVPNI